MNRDEQLVNAFIEEALALLEECEKAFLELEQNPAHVELINVCFRNIHTIKGSSGFFELQKIGQLSHTMEDFLGEIRDQGKEISSQMIDAQLKGVDTLKSMISHLDQSEEMDIEPTLLSLRNPEAVEIKKDVIKESRVETPKSKIEAKYDEFVLEILDRENSSKVLTLVESMGEVLNVSDEGEYPTIQLKTPLTRDMVESAQLGVRLQEEQKEVAASPSFEVSNVKEVSDNPKQKVSQKLQTKETSVRVSFNLLNSLIELAGEIILSRNQFVSKIEGHLLDDFKNMSQQITDLQQGLMKTRMQPLSTITASFPRVIRDLSRKLGKEVNLKIKGDELELDKSILEGLSGPFTHIIRNCLDHGIEPPKVRIEQGKNQQGTIKIQAEHRGGFIVIMISDDGKGIDPQGIKKSAVKKGLITEQQAETLSQRDAIELIWAPGFSSTDEVSDVSGRGVGMDVVRSEINSLNGFVEIESVVKEGTKLTLTMPLSTAIIQSLLIKYRSSIYAVPRNSIQEVLVIREGDLLIERVNDVEMIRYRNQLFPIVHLAHVLGEKRVYFSEGEMKESRRQSISERRQDKQRQTGEFDSGRRKVQNLTVLMIKVNRSLYGLVIDESLSQEETVVKPINEVIKKRYQHFMGTTILSNGQVSFIIDPLGIANKAKLNFSNNNFEIKQKKVETSEVQYESYLIFSGAEDERFSVIANQVEFTYQMSSEEILKVGDKQYISINDKEYELLFLSEILNVSSLNELELKEYYLIVPKYISSQIAIVAKSVVGIEKVPSDKNYVSKSERGLLGSLLWSGEMLTILDLYGIDDLLMGHSAKEMKMDKHILLVEDSPVFQKVVTDHLCSFGYKVTLAEDGAVGLSILKSQKFDLVVSDIEMPNKNGYEFCYEAKQLDLMKGIPIIAMTSLDNEDARENAQAAGFDDYLVKINRGEFFNALKKYLHEENYG